MRFSLSQLLTRWFLVFALLPAAVLGYASFRYTLVTAEYFSSQILQVVCQKEAEVVARWLSAAVDRTREEAEEAALGETPTGPELLSVYRRIAGCRSLAFAGSSGRIVVVPVSDAPAPLEEIARTVAALRKSGRPRFFLLDPPRRSIQLVFPVGTGFLWVDFDARPLEALLRPVVVGRAAAGPGLNLKSSFEKLLGFHFGYHPQLPEPGAIRSYLLAEGGALGPGAGSFNPETANLIKKQEPAPVSYTNQLGEKVLAVGKPLPDSDFVLVVEAQKSEITRGVSSQGFNMVFLAIFLTLMLSLPLSTLVTRKITEPLRRLAGEARKIAGGEFGHRVESDCPGEIGLLADTFNEMSLRLKDSYARLKEMAYNDELTGVYNRRFLLERAREELARAQRTGRPLGVVMVDVDNFKTVNDSFGHSCGDTVLREVAGVLKETARASDVVGRYGGDEFVVILPETGKTGSLSFCERVLAALQGRSFDGGRVRAKVSMGVSVWEPERGPVADPDRQLNRLLQEADDALLEAKRGGRGRAAAYTQDQE
ncbi:MAG: diguanylate cyclase [Bacillota bacterium]|nr:diguanylate cyclase [Bacillota bacterium]